MGVKRYCYYFYSYLRSIYAGQWPISSKNPPRRLQQGMTFVTWRARGLASTIACMVTSSSHYCVLVVDDHHMMRLGLKTLAQSNSVLPIDWLEAANLSDALDVYARTARVNLVLLDLNLPDSQGLQGVRRFLSQHPQARVAVFSATQDEFVVRQALALGAVGFVPKSASADATLRLIESLLQATTAVADTQPMVSVTPEAEVTHIALRDKAAKLNPTQLKVLELVLEGMSNQEIAAELRLALGTVKNTVSSVMLALDVHSRSHLISVFR
jgi:DNA-binding NarL/FixJ family response regulator